jgi:hypothetical protein
MEQIFNTVTATIGGRGVGKTAYLKGDESIGVSGVIPIYTKKNMRVLIVDTFDHPSYKDIEVIEPVDLPSFKSGVKRIFVRPDEMPELNKIINASFYNGLLVYEDAFKHQQSKLDRSIMCLIGDSKQKNVDIIFQYHCFALVPKDLYRYLDYIEIFKTKDTPEVRKESMAGYYDDAIKVHKEVMANKSRFFHKTLYTGL